MKRPFSNKHYSRWNWICLLVETMNRTYITNVKTRKGKVMKMVKVGVEMKWLSFT